MTEAEQFLKSRGLDPRKMNGYPRELTRDLVLAKPEGLIRFADSLTADFAAREEYIKHFGFAVLTAKIVKTIRPFAPLVEVGAGTGYWAYELRKAGVDVIATDPGTGEYGAAGPDWHGKFCALERIGSVAAVRKYPDRNLLTVWPDYKGAWCDRALGAFRARFVLYVGENGGCTGSDRFHAMLDEQFTKRLDVAIPQFRGIHDRLEVWERKR